jgi:hypothetical protein
LHFRNCPKTPAREGQPGQQEGAATTETTLSPLGNVITIDDEWIKNHLDRVVRGSVEETLNALLDAERIGCAMRNATSAARHEPEEAGI